MTSPNHLQPLGLLQGTRALLRLSRWRPRSRGPDDVRAEGFGMGDMVGPLIATGERFVGLLRALDPDEAERQVPGMDWTVGETATHMLTIFRRAADPRRSTTLEGLAELNDVQIAEVDTRDVRLLADGIEAHLVVLHRIGSVGTVLWALRVGRWINVPLHMGLWADMPTASSYMLLDCLAHGDDIARATGRAWDIPQDHAALALRSSLPALGTWARREVLDGPPQQARFTFPAADFALCAEVGEGAYRVRPIDMDRADVEVDPVNLFLAITGRREPEDEAATRIAAWYQPI
jgi:uncharacterized protein (TIGR03083 family)